MDEQTPPRSSPVRGEAPPGGRVDARRRRVLLAVGSAVLAGCVDDEAVETYDVTFVDDGEAVETSIEADEELLYPALDAGVEIPYACEAGVCGECTARHDGDATEVVAHEGNEYLDDDQIAAGWVLTCVAYPRADAELAVAHPDDAGE